MFKIPWKGDGDGFWVLAPRKGESGRLQKLVGEYE
jgi:hypothetical protein